MKKLSADIYIDGGDEVRLVNYVSRRISNSLQWVDQGCVVMALYDEDDKLIRTIIEGTPTPALQKVVDDLSKTG